MPHFIQYQGLIRASRCVLIRMGCLLMIIYPNVCEASEPEDLTPSDEVMRWAPHVTLQATALAYPLMIKGHGGWLVRLMSRAPWLSKFLPGLVALGSGVYVTGQISRGLDWHTVLDGLDIGSFAVSGRKRANKSSANSSANKVQLSLFEMSELGDVQQNDPEPRLISIIPPHEQKASQSKDKKQKAKDLAIIEMLMTRYDRTGEGIMDRAPEAQKLLSLPSTITKDQLRKQLAKLTDAEGEPVFEGEPLAFWNRRYLLKFMEKNLTSVQELHFFLVDILAEHKEALLEFAVVHQTTPQDMAILRAQIIEHMIDFQHLSVRLKRLPKETRKFIKDLESDIHSQDLNLWVREALNRLHPSEIPSWQFFQQILQSYEWYRLSIPDAFQLSAEQYEVFASEVLTTPLLAHVFLGRILGVPNLLSAREIRVRLHLRKKGTTVINKATRYLKLQLIHLILTGQIADVTMESPSGLLNARYHLYKDRLAYEALSPEELIVKLASKFDAPSHLTQLSDDQVGVFYQWFKKAEADWQSPREWAEYLYVYLGADSDESADKAAHHNITPEEMESTAEELHEVISGWIQSSLDETQRYFAMMVKDVLSDFEVLANQPYSQESVSEILAKIHPDAFSSSHDSWDVFEIILKSQSWYQKDLPSSSRFTSQHYEIFASEILTDDVLKHIFLTRILSLPSSLSIRQIANIHRIQVIDVSRVQLYLKLQLAHLMLYGEISELKEYSNYKHLTWGYEEVKLGLANQASTTVGRDAYVDFINTLVPRISEYKEESDYSVEVQSVENHTTYEVSNSQNQVWLVVDVPDVKALADLKSESAAEAEMVRPVEITIEGSASDTHGGWAAHILFRDGLSLRIKGSYSSTTSNRMDIIAAIKALKCLVNKESHVRVFTNSAYVVESMEDWVTNWKSDDSGDWRTAQDRLVKNQDLWHELIGVKDSHQHVEFIHTPSSTNELAKAVDREAQEARIQKINHEEDRGYVSGS